MTVDTDAPETDGQDWFVYVTAALAALNGLLFGFGTGIISGAFLYIKNALTMTPLVKGVVVSSALTGSALGMTLGGYLTNRWGHRRLILVSTIIFLVGSLVMAIMLTAEVFVVGRLIDGVAIGFVSIAGSLYFSEVMPPKVRDSLISLNQFTATVGILSSYLVNYAFADGGQWRWMLDTDMMFVVILAVEVVFMPGNPRWLVEHDREPKARDVFSRIHTDDQIRAELVEINETIETEDNGLLNLLGPWMHPTLAIGVGLAVLRQVTSINTIIYYMPTVLESTGFESSVSVLVTVDIDVVNVVMTVVTVVLIDYRGCRSLLSIGLAGMMLTLVTLGTALYLPDFSGFVGTVATGGLMPCVAFFVVGLDPVFWLLTSGICSLKVRGTAMGVVTVSNRVANLAVSLIFPATVAEIMTAGAFRVFMALSAVTLAFTYRFAPEAKGRSLGTIESNPRENVLDGSPGGSSTGTVSNDG